MNETEAKHELRRVFTAYPSFRQWLEATETPNETLTAWCAMLSGCDASDVAAVVDRVIAGDLEAVSRYEKPDALPRRIRTEANDLRSKRRERQTQLQKYHGLAKGSWEQVAKSRTGGLAIMLGELTKRGVITRDENSRRMKELMSWDKGGSVPAWLEDLATD